MYLTKDLLNLIANHTEYLYCEIVIEEGDPLFSDVQRIVDSRNITRSFKQAYFVLPYREITRLHKDQLWGNICEIAQRIIRTTAE